MARCDARPREDRCDCEEPSEGLASKMQVGLERRVSETDGWIKIQTPPSPSIPRCPPAPCSLPRVSLLQTPPSPLLVPLPPLHQFHAATPRLPAPRSTAIPPPRPLYSSCGNPPPRNTTYLPWPLKFGEAAQFPSPASRCRFLSQLELALSKEPIRLQHHHSTQGWRH